MNISTYDFTNPNMKLSFKSLFEKAIYDKKNTKKRFFQKFKEFNQERKGEKDFIYETTSLITREQK